MAADLTYILKGYELTNTQRVVYGVLEGLSRASAKRGKPYTYIGQKAIAERVGVCPRTVYAALKRLQEVGLIMVKRRGLTLTNAIYVLSPSATKEVKQATKLICESGKAMVANHINTQRIINNHIDISINPQNEAPTAQNKGITAPKGKPTNKRPHRDIEEKQKAKKRYKDYLYQRLKISELKQDEVSDHQSEVEALEKCIELIANTCAGKGKISVSNNLLTPIQWWSVVKNISQECLLNLIYRLKRANNIKNYRAYLLSSIYNSALEETLQEPWYNHIY